MQGEYHVSAEPTAVITTLLGSCVAACMYDPLARVGGMNHYLLPGEANDNREAERYSVHLMELLVNGMLKCGANRDRLQAKLFGGAKTIQNLRDIGAANARFAREFLMREGINVVGASLGGVAGRRIQFWPATGRARQMLMEAGEHVPQMSAVKQDISPQSGELELF